MTEMIYAGPAPEIRSERLPLAIAKPLAIAVGTLIAERPARAAPDRRRDERVHANPQAWLPGLAHKQHAKYHDGSNVSILPYVETCAKS